MCLVFSVWTELAACRHKTIPLYMAADHLVHSANHMYHLLYIYTHKLSHFACTVSLCTSYDALTQVQLLPYTVLTTLRVCNGHATW